MGEALTGILLGCLAAACMPDRWLAAVGAYIQEVGRWVLRR